MTSKGRGLGRGSLLLLMLVGVATTASGLEIAPVVVAELPRVYRLDGTAEAVQRGTVSAQTSGRVVEVSFDVDDLVRKGDVIVQIDDARQQAGVRQAEANLEAATAKRRDAEQEYQRIRGVFAKDAVSKADMDRVTAAFHQARANAEAAEAALHQAREELAYTRVRAPYNGLVTERLVEIGEMAQPGQRLMSGLSLEQMRVAVDVPQNLIVSIREEGEAQVEIGGRWIAAEGITVFPIADPSSDTFKVRLRLPGDVEGVFPGMYVKVGFVAGKQASLVIPLSAVVARSEVIGAYVVDAEGRVVFRHIRLGSPAGPDHVSVLSGLSEGEQVARDPVAAGILLKSQRTAQVGDE